MKKVFKFTFRLILLGMLVLTAHIFIILHEGTQQPVKSADTAVILGNAVRQNGTLSDRLAARVERGFELYNSGMVKQIVVSGGKGYHGYYEGSKMKEYLIAKGVPEKNVIVDNYGYNTSATALNTKTFAKIHGIENVIVVSQYFHITRTKMLFKKNGFKNVQGASPEYTENYDIYSIIREIPAFYKDLF